jgi:hypothetical protein
MVPAGQEALLTGVAYYNIAPVRAYIRQATGMALSITGKQQGLVEYFGQ